MFPFSLQLPVSVFESVIDIINGEVLFIFHIFNTSFSFSSEHTSPPQRIVSDLSDAYVFCYYLGYHVVC